VRQHECPFQARLIEKGQEERDSRHPDEELQLQRGEGG
jgi:hypothetical protein